jgi:hypothetical protein
MKCVYFLPFLTAVSGLSIKLLYGILKNRIHKGNTVLCHEDIRQRAVTDPPFMMSALDRGEWSASCPDHFTSGTKLMVLIE